MNGLKLYDVLKKLNILKKSEQIIKMDESGFAGEAGRHVVVVKRGIKYANQQVNSIHYVEAIHVNLIF